MSHQTPEQTMSNTSASLLEMPLDTRHVREAKP